MRGIEPMGGEAGPIEIRTGKTPQHHAVPRRAPLGHKPSEDAGGKGGSHRAVLLITARSEDLVQSAPREPAVRQHPIDRGDSERQHPMHRRCRPLDPPNPFTKRQDKIVRHASGNPMLSFCSYKGGLSIPSC